MKKLITVLFFQLLLTGAFAQINFETEYNHSGAYTNLSVSGTKFYVMDVGNNQCRIYHTDHSLWKTVNLTVPADHYLYDVKFVSENLFTTDNNLALAYVYYSYDETGQYYTYFARIISENGTVLLTIPGAQYLYVNDLGEEGVKLVAYVYDYSVYPYTIKTRVYDLPGEPTNSPVIEAGHFDLTGQPFPNPAGEFTQIPYDLPAGIEEATIVLTDINGKNVQEYRVDRTFKNLYVNTGQLPSGTYFYRLITGAETSPAKKLVVH